MASHVCAVDAGFGFLSNYSQGVTGFPGLCLSMPYLGCVNANEKADTAFWKRQKSPEFSH